MARYGEDFSGGRRNRRKLGDLGIGYDQGYFGPYPGGRESRGRGPGWGEIDSPRDRPREGEFGPWNRSGERWGSGGHSRDRGMEGGFVRGDWRDDFPPAGGRRYSSADSPMGRSDFDDPERVRFRGNRYDSNESGGYRGRESVGESWRSSGGGYDRDFGDRVRRGWNPLRNEAREMFDRGYDRGW